MSLTWVDRLRAPWNALRYALRRRIGYSRGEPSLPDESKADLFDYLGPSERAAAGARELELRQRYGLEPLRVRSSRLDYRDNLYLIDVLEGLLDGLAPPERTATLSAVDVGSKNYAYAFGLERFWRHFASTRPRAVTLEGVEIDGHGVYPDLFARCDYARAFARQTGNPGVTYRIADFLDCRYDALDVVTLLFPFLTRESLIRWGLPLDAYAPERIVAHAAAALRPGGWIVSFHQTEEEKRELVALVGSHPRELEIQRTRPLRSRLVDYYEDTLDRWAVLCVRSAKRSGTKATDSAAASANSAG